MTEGFVILLIQALELQGKAIAPTVAATAAYVSGTLGRIYFPLPGDLPCERLLHLDSPVEHGCRLLAHRLNPSAHLIRCFIGKC